MRGSEPRVLVHFHLYVYGRHIMYIKKSGLQERDLRTCKMANSDSGIMENQDDLDYVIHNILLHQLRLR